MTDILIGSQFNGPPNSGNGGYSAGALGVLMDGPARVSLRSPPPLDTPLEVRDTGERLEAWHDETLVMFAESATPVCQPPAPPSLELAKQGPKTFANAEEHNLPTCFVCGPLRKPGDGLCLFTGPVDGFEGVADIWTPDDRFTGDDGLIQKEIIWAALDCPSYFAIPGGTPLALLASICARIDRRPKAGETLIVAGWHIRSEGRKHFTATGLFTPGGDLIAQADTLWIELKQT